MKNTLLFSLFILYAITGNGQVPSLHENFDVACATSGWPSGWLLYNPSCCSAPQERWTCSSEGRASTPGMQVTGYYSSSFHLDTSYLVTPLLNFSTYHGGPIYLDYDVKADSITLGGELKVFVEVDSPFTPTGLFLDVSDSTIPLLGITDSVGWTTHQVNLTNFEDSASFYITFRYISSTSAGTIWFLDNVNTNTHAISLRAPGMNKYDLPLTVVGNSTPDKVTLSYTASSEGQYHVALYDMFGRKLHQENVNAQIGKNDYSLDGLGLQPGMYFIKMDNGSSYGFTKALVQ